MNIVFCRTRYEYQSYTDFWQLVALAGFETVWLDELEPRHKNVYIVTPRNGELPAVLSRLQGKHSCKFVWWCLERPDQQGSVTEGQPLEPGIDKLWLSDFWLANVHHRAGWGPVQFVPVGSHRDLGEQAAPPWKCDWTHLSYATSRRIIVYSRIEGRLLGNCWDPTRDRALQHTKLLVDVHQDNWPVLDPLRLALAAGYGISVIAEEVNNSWPYRPDWDVLFVPYDQIVQEINAAIRGERADIGEEPLSLGAICRQRMTTEFEFGKCVKEAVGVLTS